MGKPSVKDMVAAQLKELGYDGLYTEDCGCQLSDLMPCGTEGIENCQAGYKRPAEPDDCEWIWQEGNWMIGPTKEKGASDGEGS